MEPLFLLFRHQILDSKVVDHGTGKGCGWSQAPCAEQALFYFNPNPRLEKAAVWKIEKLKRNMKKVYPLSFG